jgi:heptosyltransferase-2
MKILIIQTAFIGDVILATPLIEKLHQFYPGAQIDFLLKKGHESLFDQHPYLRKVMVLEKGENKYRNIQALIQNIRKENYNWVINVHRFFSSGLITAFSGAKVRIGFDKNPLSFFYTHKVKHQIDAQDVDNHEVKRNLALITPFTDTNFVKPKLHPQSPDFLKIQPQEPYICIAPASVWFTKQYPAERWVELIDGYADLFAVYLLGGKGDLALCESIQAKCKAKKVHIAVGQLSFLESAALMSKASMNFVNDSAPLHLASAMNAPVTAIFCATTPAFGFGPLSDVSQTVETTEKLDCKPCNLHGKTACPQGHFKCSHISAAQIMEAAQLG